MKSSRLSSGLKIAILFLLIATVGTLVALSECGVFTATNLNSHSLLDFRIGRSIRGIESRADGSSETFGQFSWFDDSESCGLVSNSGTTVYYMGRGTFGNFCVMGFTTTEKSYNVLGIKVGSDEAESKIILLHNGYRMTGGGMNSCVAVNDTVTVSLTFEKGEVSGISVRLRAI